MYVLIYIYIYIRDSAAAVEARREEMQDKLLMKNSMDRPAINRKKIRKGEGDKTPRIPLTGRSSLASGDEALTDHNDEDLNIYIAQTMQQAGDNIAELLRGSTGSTGEGDEGHPNLDTLLDKNASSSSSLLPEYIIRVSDEGQLTSDQQLTPAELFRRRLLSELKYKVVLIVNGRVITHSDPTEILHPSLIANFNQYFELRLIHEPTDVSIDIYAVSVGTLACLTKETLVANVSLPIPGQGIYSRGGKKPAAHVYAPRTGIDTFI